MTLLPSIIFKGNCEVCSAPIRIDEKSFEISEGGLLCTKDDCYEEYYQCSNCEKYTYVDNSYYLEGEYTYCQDCYDENAFECKNCNANCRSEDSDLSAYRICSNCQINYIECEDCNTLVELDYSFSCDACDYTYCEDCYTSDHQHDGSRDGDYSPISCTTKGSKIKIKRFVGVELEAEDGDRSQLFDNLDSSCGIDDDGSLNNGSEVKTPPRELKDLEDMIKHTTQIMRDAGFQIHDTCGLHVHIDGSDFRTNYSKIAQLFRTFYVIEPIIYAMLPSKRRHGTYSQPLFRDYSFNSISTHIKPDKIDEAWYQGSPMKHDHHHGSRYHGLNLHSLFYRGTVEFRYHSGSLNPTKILNWINFLLHAVEYATEKYKYDDIIKIRRMKNPKRKFDFIMKLFKIDRVSQEYLKSRILKNSPGYFDREEIE